MIVLVEPKQDCQRQYVLIKILFNISGGFDTLDCAMIEVQ